MYKKAEYYNKTSVSLLSIFTLNTLINVDIYFSADRLKNLYLITVYVN